MSGKNGDKPAKRQCVRSTKEMSHSRVGRPALSLVCTPWSEDNLKLANQISCGDVVYYNMDDMPSLEGLKKHKEEAEAAGLSLSVIEGGPPCSAIVDGGPPELRQEQMDNFIACVRAMGEVGIPVLCYNFMPSTFRVGRSSYETPIRGGALSSSFDLNDFIDDSKEPEQKGVTGEKMWANLKWFLDRVIPVAEECGVYLALHPDDPPISQLKGTTRIFNTLEAFRRLVALNPSTHNGITFDVSLFSLMLGGEDNSEEKTSGVCSALCEFRDYIHFVHFRDVVGTRDKYTEVFHDEGGTDHVRVMNTLYELGYKGPLRPDHVPLMQGEEGHGTGYKAKGYFSGKASGYTMLGRLYACGYLRGLMQSAEVKAKERAAQSPRVVCVTGGANGIGRAICLAFANLGAHVYCGDIDDKQGNDLASEVRNTTTGHLTYMHCDFGQEVDCSKLIECAIAKEGCLDVLVNNVGIQDGKPAHECTTANYDKVMNINVRSYFVCAKAAISHWLKVGSRGVVVNIASVQGMQSQGGIPAYASSKGAILSLTRQLANDYSQNNIRVNSVCPGTINTPLVARLLAEAGNTLEDAAKYYPSKRCGEPYEIADAVVWLSSDKASNVTGEAVCCDGGIMAMGSWALGT